MFNFNKSGMGKINMIRSSPTAIPPAPYVSRLRLMHFAGMVLSHAPPKTMSVQLYKFVVTEWMIEAKGLTDWHALKDDRNDYRDSGHDCQS